MTRVTDSPPALFLDRDGTIIRDVGFLSDPAGVAVLEGAKDALHRVAKTHRLYLFSNQSGIGRGYYTMEQAQAVNARMLELLELPPPGFSDSCLAREAPDEPAVFRKPSPRFILTCMQRDGLDPARCWMIGDRLSDLQAGINAGIHAALIHNAEHFKEETRLFCETHDLPVFVSLAQAVQTLF
jgi:D-glycero-D-manno-heptose 1,7-bisphosphate phosphatase